MAKILYIWQGGYPWEIRVEKVCLALKQQGHRVAILARGKADLPREDEIHGLRVVRVGNDLPGFCTMPISANPIWQAAINQEIASWKPDLVMPREIMLSVAASKACRRRNIPVIIDMAEHYPATMRAFKKYQSNPISRFIVSGVRIPDRVEERSVTIADGVVTVCDEQNHRLHKTYGCSYDKMAVVHNTPELGIFAGARLGSARPPKVFAYHGSMSAQRGLDILIRGFSLAAASHPGIRLELAGSGESYPDLVELALNAKVSDRIRFTGSYRFEELTGLYSEADIGMITYPIDESVDHTIGNKLFDYMACGKPVIVSPAIPLKRIVEGTQVGIVIDQCSPEGIKQGIEKMLISDIEPYSRNGIAASQERYNWNHDSEVLNSFIQGYL